MKNSPSIPSRDTIISMIAKNMYSDRIINNSHRGDVVEMIVLLALDPDWSLVGLGWHPWDLQRGSGKERVRIQVKQSAALQLWGPTKAPALTFGWKKSPPEYFYRDNPNEEIEKEGWFCDLFVFGLHQINDPAIADQVDPSQWSFFVIPKSDLKPMQNSMNLKKALKKWKSISWSEINSSVNEVIKNMK